MDALDPNKPETAVNPELHFQPLGGLQLGRFWGLILVRVWWQSVGLGHQISEQRSTPPGSAENRKLLNVKKC